MFAGWAYPTPSRVPTHVGDSSMSRYSSLQSQARALIQSRWTVRTVTPSNSAVSFSVRPQKKR